MWLQGNYINMPVGEDEYIGGAKNILRLIPQ
jgi:hypothetical protein